MINKKLCMCNCFFNVLIAGTAAIAVAGAA